MDGLRGAGRDLVVIERHENVLRVAAVDAVSVAVEHEDIDEVAARINLPAVVQGAAAADRLSATGDGHVEPDLVRVDRALGEGVAQFQRADHDVEEIVSARSQRRNGRSQRSDQRGIDRVAFMDCKDIDAGRTAEKTLVDLRHIGPPAQPGHGRIGGGEQVVMDAQFLGAREELGPEIVRRDERHVTGRARRLCLIRIVETPCPVAGNAAE